MVVKTVIAIRQRFALPTYFSGAVGECREYKSQKQNKQTAWKRMAESKKFKEWHRIEVARRLGHLEKVQELVNEQLADQNLKIEYF